VPTFALFRADQLVQRRTGSQSMQQLLRLLDEAL
jgi:hypothetical protein